MATGGDVEEAGDEESDGEKQGGGGGAGHDLVRITELRLQVPEDGNRIKVRQTTGIQFRSTAAKSFRQVGT